MPRFKTLRVSDPAKQDLALIGARTQHQWGKAQKTKYLGHFRATFELLRNSPGAGKPRENISPGLRSHPVRRHVIFYREKKTVVEIVRVLHEAMDPDRHLHR